MKNNKNTPWWLWAILALVSFIFFMAGLTSFTGKDEQRAIFRTAHYPTIFFYFIAVVQLIGAILLWIPSTRLYAALLLMFVMAGALVTQLVASNYIHVFSPLLFGGLLCLLFIRWRQVGS